ncbi:MAG: 50S ribosome-binding GTPase [Thermoplasmata archaeon]|nr:50S ribosome-binding GTPase [Thermoplasmata archaeon]
MFKIPTILTHDELLEKAFHRAAKISEKTKIRNKVKRHKILVLSKLDVVTDTIDSTLNKYIKAFPSFNQLHKFEFELIDLTIGIDKLRKSLGAIDWARQQVLKLRKVLRNKINRVASLNDYPKLESYRGMFYGRVSSVIAQVADNLEFLNSARNALKKLPKIDPEVTTIVVAGYPNVGKSLIVKQISSAKPAVAKYPFTTKQLNIGHIIIDNEKVQIIDTPGVLDRSPEKRNKLERQAIMALRYLANLIIFILDPSEHCGYTIDEQKRLLAEIRELFHDVKILEIENKVDLFKSTTDRLKISAIDDQGLDKLLELMIGMI